ncbi:hypothetical protein [Arenimonas daejeonensis]|uniref:hypothetical protein n=1 Tax=Arenimonas daejeonensis TaxID=370777 RepID=UPI0011BFB939|nr:hypothetical protein [Arenimonas daejeonensis]
MNSALRFAAPLVLASLVLSLSACNKSEDEHEAETPAADAQASDTAKTEPGAPPCRASPVWKPKRSRSAT